MATLLYKMLNYGDKLCVHVCVGGHDKLGFNKKKKKVIIVAIVE